MSLSVGLALITFNRPDYLRKSLERLAHFGWGGAGKRLVVVDEEFEQEKYGWVSTSTEVEVLYQPNSGVASAKNLALRALLKAKCEHLFLIEDDILLEDDSVCMKYLEYAQTMDVPHLNFALHGELNKGQGKTVLWKREDGRKTQIYVYPSCVGAFSYYSRKIIEEIGFFDENFKNAWDHVEHTWRICNTKKIPPFWYFMDLPQSQLLLSEIPGSLQTSTIRNDKDWAGKIEEGKTYWLKKHGAFLPKTPKWRNFLNFFATEVVKSS